MVFSSVPPVYLDPPNWHHHHQLQQQEPDVQAERNGELTPPAAAGNNNKPNSMSERARVAKIPQPETALKCPRCESTNTKFCYFNNYNLSQPRHFCKTCRRYWTRGGALRNVPVGGGCRRNKKISKKTTSSKSRGATDHHQKHAISTQQQQHNNNFPPQSSFLQNLGPFGGLNLRAPMASGSAHDSILSADQWSSGSIMQNFPFLAGGFHQAPPAGAINSNHLFTFQNEGSVGEATRPGVSDAAKMEDSQLGLSSAATSFLGNNSHSQNQYYSNSWGGGNGNMWNGSAGGGDQLPCQQLNSSGSGDHATTHYL